MSSMSFIKTISDCECLTSDRGHVSSRTWRSRQRYTQSTDATWNSWLQTATLKNRGNILPTL